MRELILDFAAGNELELAGRYCGITVGKANSFRGFRAEFHMPCPFCAGKDRFWYSARRKRFYCRQCRFNGNIIDLIMAVNGISYWKALETLAAEFGVIAKMGKE